MKSWGKLFSSAVAASLVSFTPLAVNAQIITNVFETWESQATGPFTGAGDVTWVGDTAPFRIATEAWPSSPAQDFAGTRSIRHTNAVASTSTILTSFSLDGDSPTLWQVFASGNSADVSSGRGFDLILMSRPATSMDTGSGLPARQIRCSSRKPTAAAFGTPSVPSHSALARTSTRGGVSWFTASPVGLGPTGTPRVPLAPRWRASTPLLMRP